MSAIQILPNQIYKLPQPKIVKSNTYRVIAIYPEKALIALFPLDDVSKLKRPILLDSNDVERFIKEGSLLKEFAPKLIQTSHDDDIPNSHKLKRDHNYSLIKDLIEFNYEDFIYRISISKKSDVLKKHAVKNNLQITSIYRALNRYWYYGQTKNALLPHYFKSGNSGREMPDSEKKRGRPISSYSGLMKFEQGRSVTDNDKKIFNKYIKEYINTAFPLSIAKVHRMMIDLEQSYRDESLVAEKENRKANNPSLTQFRYWEKKLNSNSNKMATQGPTYKRKQDNRDSTKGVNSISRNPGDSFQIDATIADVYVVYKFDRSVVLGRPVIYSVNDTATRMIVGLHVTLGNPSWNSVKHALYNTFTSKSDFCQRYGIQIKDIDWPCHHAPREIICDRGEMIGLQPEDNLPLCTLRFTGAGRPEMKGVVERTFRIYNDEHLHNLDGTTRGKSYSRMDTKPATKATYTLDEITKILTTEVLKQNAKSNSDVKNLKLIIQSGQVASPVNAWNLYLSKHQHSLKIYPSQQVLANLLNKTTVSVTEYGFEKGDLCYTCEEAEASDLFTLSKRFGEYKLDARYNKEVTSYIFVKLKKDGPFVKCHLTPRLSDLANISHFDYSYLRDVRKRNEQNEGATSIRAKMTIFQENIKKEATQEKSEQVIKNNVKGIAARRTEAAKKEQSIFRSDEEPLEDQELPKQKINSPLKPANNVVNLLNVRPTRKK